VARARDESGFGMLELLIAMVILNIGLFALIGVFNASTVALRRAGDVSAATVVADKQMELYRSLQSCAIWLDQWLFPAAGSQYALDTFSYNGTASYAPAQIPYWSTVTSPDQQYWVTDGMDANNFNNNQMDLNSCAYKTMTTSQPLPLTSINGSAANINSLGTITPMSNATSSTVKPVQPIAGPNGVSYTVDTYIVLVQPPIVVLPTLRGEWAKQVTITVLDPRDATHVLARETSVFDPTASP
jgi:type II secretory pathway pseudopilin PulG